MLPTSLVVAIASIYEFSLSESYVLESVVIEKYFHLGYDNETITDLPQVYHIITMSVCTLTRRLQSYNLVERQIKILIYKKQAFNLFLFNPFYNGKPRLCLQFYVLRRRQMIYAH